MRPNRFSQQATAAGLACSAAAAWMLAIAKSGVKGNTPMSVPMAIAPPRWLIGSAVLWMAAPAFAAILTGSTGSHDPSRMTNCNGVYYVYSTGGTMMSSTDRINWTSGVSPFTSGVPASVAALIPSNQGIWAPDVIYLNNKYYGKTCLPRNGLSALRKGE